MLLNNFNITLNTLKTFHCHSYEESSDVYTVITSEGFEIEIPCEDVLRIVPVEELMGG